MWNFSNSLKAYLSAWVLKTSSPCCRGSGGSAVVDGVVELVLDGGEEALGGRGVLVVVDAGGVDVGNLLAEAALGQADLTELIEQVLEVVLADEGAVLHAPTVDDVAADGEVTQHAGGHRRNWVARTKLTR